MYLCVFVHLMLPVTHRPSETDFKVKLQQESLLQAAPSCEFTHAGSTERYGLLSVSVSSSVLQPINLLKDVPKNFC